MRLLRRRRRRDQRGAVAMEAALVLPVVVLLVFGMIDMSLMLRDYVSVTSATRTASRLAVAEADAGQCKTTAGDTTSCTTAQGTSIPEAAQDAADTAQRNLSGVAGNSVNYLLIYEANKNGFPCAIGNSRRVYTTTSTLNNCNPNLASSAAAADNNTTMPPTCSGYGNCLMFKWNKDAAGGAGAFRYDTSGSTGWDSRLISACTNKEDSVGIYINLTHKWLTGLWSGGVTMADKSVMKFEPLPSDTCDSTKVSAHP